MSGIGKQSALRVTLKDAIDIMMPSQKDRLLNRVSTLSAAGYQTMRRQNDARECLRKRLLEPGHTPATPSCAKTRPF